MDVSKVLKAKRMALSSITMNSDEDITPTTYEEMFLYYYNNSQLDELHDGTHRIVRLEDLDETVYTIGFCNINYNFTSNFKYEPRESDPYHTIKHGMDGIVRGEIFVGEIEFVDCWCTPVIKYSKNLITGEYDFSETETELVGYDGLTASKTSVSIEEDALPKLFNIMVDVVNNGVPSFKQEYDSHVEIQRREEERQSMPQDDDIPF